MAQQEQINVLNDKLNEDFDAYGLKITRFVIENVSMPDDLKKEIFDYSRLNKIDMQKLAQFRTTESIETAAANQGIGGIGVGVGVGMGMGKIVGDVMSNTTQQINTPPPPPPVVQFFTAVNGQQNGPFGLDQLPQLVQNGSLKRDTLVWKTGMANWTQASNVIELNSLFSNVPPPPPPVG